uniref:antigen WC1.1 n=1 Tax=Monopterus albus TaxID=43700 RepID=UPI0009B38A8C|nr:antigen WC1.1-like [Monopterus albus]
METLGITCEEHKVIFLKGENPCSGLVGVEHGSKIYWLSGSNKTWNQQSANIVCQQMHCGKATSLTSVPKADMEKVVWDKFYNCSPNTKSLFDCEAKTASPDHNYTIASVTCSGTISVNLTNECWGNVNVCVNGKCGGVCADTWTHTQSEILCKSLGCGDKALRPNNQPKKSSVIFKSLHTTKQTTSLTQCNFVKYSDSDTTCNQNPAYVVCSGSVKPRFSISSTECFGNVQLSYEGKWLPVCNESLEDLKIRDTICEELGCGHGLGIIEHFGPKPAGDHVISELECPGTKSLKACNITSKKTSCSLAGLKCSNWRKIKVKGTCSGAVYIDSEGKSSPVSTGGWTEAEGQRLCQDLKCGGYKSINNHTTSETHPFWNRSFSCADVQNPQNIWACEKQTSPIEEQQLLIECQGTPKVTLSEECHGVLRINETEVCSTDWTYSPMACQEMNCSNAIDDFFTDPKPNAMYQHVSCEDYHYELGQCRRSKGPCTAKVLSISCVGSVKFNTTEKCGGQLTVKYGNQWESVCPLTLSDVFKDKLCQELGCGGYNKSIKIPKSKDVANLKTALKCTENHKDIKHCVRRESCNKVRPAEIYCHGFEWKQPATGTPIVPIILGAGFLLVLVIIIIVCVRICNVKRAKNAMKVPLKTLSRNDVEVESGNYEDIESKPDEMEDFSGGRFRSEAEVTKENKAHSTSSFSYDDIDEATEAQALTSQAATANASDEITYEVDDPQDSYDDIEDSPEVMQTIAEVHHCSRTTPESDAAVSSELVQVDEDYLVPGQDG